MKRAAGLIAALALAGCGGETTGDGCVRFVRETGGALAGAAIERDVRVDAAEFERIAGVARPDVLQHAHNVSDAARGLAVRRVSFGAGPACLFRIADGRPGDVTALVDAAVLDVRTARLTGQRDARGGPACCLAAGDRAVH